MKTYKIILNISISFLALFIIPGNAMGVRSKSVSIIDFTVQSVNPSYKFLGKGFAEFVGIELSKSGVELVERRKMTELLKEQELGMTGLIDEASQIKMGKMLAANYIVTGNIFDIAGKLSVTFKVISTETGKILIQDKVDGKVASYEYISALISKKILNGFKLNIPESIALKVEKKTEKQEAAVVNFSKAIDAYDRNDMKAAKKELEKAKAIDPENEAVNIYLGKISTTSPKFKIQLETYSPTQNPARLGMIKQDRMYFMFSNTIETGEYGMESVGNGYNVAEMPTIIRSGMDIPVFDNLGINLEFNYSNVDNKIETPAPFTYFGEPGHTYFHPMVQSIGGIFSIGFSLNNNICIGAAFNLYNTKTGHILDGSEEWLHKENKIDFAGDIGFLIRTLDERIIFDVHAVMSTQEQYFFDAEKMEAKDNGKVPVIIEGTLTTSFFNRSLFIVLKGISEIYSDDRDGYTFRGVPVIEYWPVSFLSLRSGYEYAYINISGNSLSGSGYMAGLTLRIYEFDIDFNFTKRYKPVKVLPGYGKNDMTILASITKHATFFE